MFSGSPKTPPPQEKRGLKKLAERVDAIMKEDENKMKSPGVVSSSTSLSKDETSFPQGATFMPEQKEHEQQEVSDRLRDFVKQNASDPDSEVLPGEKKPRDFSDETGLSTPTTLH